MPKMIFSAGRSIRTSIGSFTTSVSREKISYSDINSVIISGLGSGSSSTSGSGYESSTTSTSLLSRIFLTPARSSLHPVTKLLNCGSHDVKHTGYKEDIIRQINIDSRYGHFSTINKLLRPASFGHSNTSAQVSRRNN